MKLETVGELRELIKQNGGVLTIGTIAFETEDGKDIDVRHKGELCMWFSSSVSNHETIVGTESVTGVFQEKTTTEINLQEVNENLIAEITTLKSELEKNKLSLGKVEAYEKLLIGRELTIGK
jgi:hypothetical protein